MSARSVTQVALLLIALAWACRLAWSAVPALCCTDNIAAEALYLAELEQQRSGAAVPVAPTLEAIAREVHGRATRVSIWIGLGLGLCLVAALVPRSRPAATIASGVLFLAGWVGLDAYAHVGLLHGLDLKARLIQQDLARLVRFVVVDACLPVLVAAAVLAVLVAVPERHTRST